MENFCNITLYTNAFFLAAACLILSRKWKLDCKGSIKNSDAQIFGVVVCSISIFWTFLMTILLSAYWSRGETSIKEHWIPFLMFITGANTYIIYRLNEGHQKSLRRQSILFMLKKYPSPEMTLEKMNEFCKVFDLEDFPILVFRRYLSRLEEKKEEGDLIGKAFENLKNNLSLCKDYESLKKSAHSHENYRTIHREGGFS